MNLNRRGFLEFLGKGVAGAALLPPMTGSLLARHHKEFSLKAIKPSEQDRLVLARGFKSRLLVRWGDPISDNDSFGFNNDYIAFLPQSESEALLWVNHEYVDPLFVSGYDRSGPKTMEQVQIEQYNVGGSVIKIRRDGDGIWQLVENDPLNKRITGLQPIAFDWPEKILDAEFAVGTLANCSGGVTPWGSILTCEENFDMFYGDRDFKTGERITDAAEIGWHEVVSYPPEHYGWVVEVDPLSGDAKKLVGLGRFAHECATVTELPDGRLVVYSGDDAVNQHLYKFISSEPGSLSEGTLYVANVPLGKWIPLVRDESEVLQKLFANQTEVLIRAREASRFLGGTPLDRPEDIEIDPVTGHVHVSLTNNATVGNYFGSIMKIMETDNKHDALTFTSETFLAGGEETGFACPDNLAFDKRGNLWFTSDMSTTLMNKSPYEAFKNNGLFLVPRDGEYAGEVIQVASAPVGAELTGPCFSEDGRTLFLSVQHPGENSPNLANLTSHWPDGGNAMPKPSVVQIYGPALDALLEV